MTTSPRIALVLGATGGIGGTLARRLQRDGWQVRALHRAAAATSRAAGDTGLQWLQGDAMQRDEVVAAAVQGAPATLIVHAVNPPGYRHWEQLVLPMIDNSIAAARATGARILLPGTIYNYGPDALAQLTETSPQHPVTRKGAIRVQLEQRLRAAADDGVRSLIVRAGDFFGPQAGNNWLSQGLVKPGRTVTAITYPGKPGLGHQWAYLPDVAETMLQLVNRPEALATFDTFHMQGHWDQDGTRMIEAIRTTLAKPALPVRAFPWWLVPLAAPLVPFFSELKEMRYLWQQAIRMDNAKLRSVLGSEPHTPLAQAMRSTLDALACD